MKYLTILIFIVLVGNGCAQENDDCENILNKTIELSESQEDLEIFLNNFKTLMYCKFDSVDYYMFAGPHNDFSMVGSLLVELSSQTPDTDAGHTFNQLYGIIVELQKQDGYKEIRKIAESSLILLPKKANLSNWETDKILLKNIGLDNNQIDEVFKFISQNKNTDKTFQDVLQFIITKKQNPKQIETSSIVILDSCNTKTKTEYLGGLFYLTSYKEAIKCSKKLNKPMLIFFDGFACINAIQMKDLILMNNRVKPLINNNFIFVKLMVDDRTILKEEDWYKSKYDKQIKKTVGQQNSDFQITKFNNNTQPAFYILSASEEIIAKTFYDLDEENFIKFLIKGIN